MVNVDQRPPIFALLERTLGLAPGAVPFEQVLLVKRVLVEVFSDAASAILVDPNFGYPAAAGLLNPARGLLMTLEDHRTTPDRRSSTIADWSVARIRALGGDAVKLLAWYRPRAGTAVREHQQAWVQRVGEDCARHDIPFVLELLLYHCTATTLPPLVKTAPSAPTRCFKVSRSLPTPAFGSTCSSSKAR